MIETLIQQSTAFEADSHPILASTEGQTTALAKVGLAMRETPPAWLATIRTRLEDLASLRANWNSYGAAPVDRDSISNAQNTILFLARFVGVEEPTIGATPDGDVGLSWDGGSWSLDVEVHADGVLQYVYLDENDPSRDEDRRTRRPTDLLPFLTAW